MFRFWYRYVFANRTLIETGAQQAVWERRIKPDYYSYMGLVFEKVCMDYLNAKNAKGELPILYTSIGRWWGTNAATHGQEEIDLIANDGKDYLFGECKWRNEKLDISVLKTINLCMNIQMALMLILTINFLIMLFVVKIRKKLMN